MRIAILSCFYPFRGGISQLNAAILQELGKEHTVKAFNFKRQYPEFLFPGKTQYVTPDDEAVPVESEALLDSIGPVSWIKSARKIKEWNPDVLIIRYWVSYLAPALGFVARHMSKKCKVIAIFDNVIPHERHFFDKPLSKYFLSGIDGGVTLSPEVGQDLEELSPGKPKTVIAHPIYCDHFGTKMERKEAENLLGLEHGKKNLLFFGLIREYKGLDILLEAFNLLDDSYQLIVAGEPYGSFDRYRQIIDASKAKDRIYLFLDYIKDSEVSRFFSAADVVVLPYRSATQSGVSATGFHFEVPIIVTDVGGLKSAIEGPGTGMVAAEVTPACIAYNIRRFFADSRAREGFVESIRKENERLSIGNFCRQLVQFINGISL